MAVRPPALSGKERYERFVTADTERSRAMAPEQAVSAAHVSGTVLKALDRLHGRDGEWNVEPRPVRGRDSWVFKAHTPLAPWPLAVKVYCAAVAREDIAGHGDHLRKSHEQMGRHPEFAVPAFWACLPKHRALVMQWIEAPRMNDLLRRAGGRSDERSRLFAAAGGWLRHYHNGSEPDVRPLKVKSFARHVDVLLGGEDGAGANVRDSVFRTSYEALVECGKEAGKCRVSHVTTHGDFVPHNVFHGDGRTVGFDMVPRTRPALSDICHFLVHAEVEKPLTLRRARLGPTGLGQQDADAFFGAYGGRETVGSEALLAYMQLNETLLRWAVIISQLRRGGRRRPQHLISWMRYRRMAASSAAALRNGLRFTEADDS